MPLFEEPDLFKFHILIETYRRVHMFFITISKTREQLVRWLVISVEKIWVRVRRKSQPN